jgi:phage baseplate assembly protein gpV
MNIESLINLIHREASRVVERLSRENVGVVTSYDPQKHAVKVNMQPEGDTLSGWITLRQSQAGNQYGWHVAPMIGDHASLAFHEDDREAATVIGYFFNDKQTPLAIQSGECRYKSPFGPDFYFKNDGTWYIKGKDGKSNVTIMPDGTIDMGSADGVANVTLKPDGTIIATGHDGATNCTIKPDGNVWMQGHGGTVGILPDGDCYAKPNNICWLGGDGGGGGYDFVLTNSGPSINVKAKI